MSLVATLSVTPIHDGSLSDEIAAAVSALDGYDVSYETNPMGTVIEAADPDELFAAARAAHEAADAERVRTVLQIDDDRTREQGATERVAAVEDELGREPADESSS